jgi:hypothetical protein
MFKNATFLPFYFADNQLFSNSETLVSYNISDTRVNRLLSEILYDSLINTGADLKRKIFNKGGHKIISDLRFVLKFLNEE